MLARSQVVGNVPSADAVITADSRSANASNNASPLFILNILPVSFLDSPFYGSSRGNAVVFSYGQKYNTAPMIAQEKIGSALQATDGDRYSSAIGIC
jgi:hypothetical protein